MTDDKDVQAAALVSAALAAITGRTPGLDQATARQRVSAAAGEILNAPEDIRRRCILLAAAESHRWQADTVLSLIGRKPAGLTADDIVTLLPALPRLLPWAQQSLAKGAADALLTQLEATWADADGHRQLRGPRRQAGEVTARRGQAGERR